MDSSSIAPLGSFQGPTGIAQSVSAKDNAEGFGEILKKSIAAVNGNITHADQMVRGLVAGEHANIHETMIAMEKASISLRMMTKLQQKVLEAYRETMRMQI